MRSTLIIAALLFFTAETLLAQEREQKRISELAQKLNLYGGAKATIQWKRVFSSQRHLKRYKLEKLDQTTRDRLEIYLIKHAADSEQPIVPGLL
ncbi:MAG: hypothetical protein ABXS93_07295 [Sulfurimonas sp.]